MLLCVFACCSDDRQLLYKPLYRILMQRLFPTIFYSRTLCLLRSFSFTSSSTLTKPRGAERTPLAQNVASFQTPCILAIAGEFPFTSGSPLHEASGHFSTFFASLFACPCAFHVRIDRSFRRRELKPILTKNEKKMPLLLEMTVGPAHSSHPVLHLLPNPCASKDHANHRNQPRCCSHS